MTPGENDLGWLLRPLVFTGSSAPRRAVKSYSFYKNFTSAVGQILFQVPAIRDERPGSIELAFSGEFREDFWKKEDLAVASLALCVYQADTQPAHLFVFTFE